MPFRAAGLLPVTWRRPGPLMPWWPFPDGRVLVTGGLGPNRDAVASAEMYSPSTGLWAPIEAMSEPRVGHTATLLPDGRVLVAGGHSVSS